MTEIAAEKNIKYLFKALWNKQSDQEELMKYLVAFSL